MTPRRNLASWSPGTRRHIKGALAVGATPEEIMEVLKLCVCQGAQACNLGVPILEQELKRRGIEAG
jgi:alkylhydroperoxidase/carboxymuconolactone decarboxylase family protein YurZ